MAAIPGERAAGRARRGSLRLLLAAPIAAGWAAGVSFLPVGLLVAVGTWSRPEQSLRPSLAVWLLAHGVPVAVGNAPGGQERISLVPLALTALAVWRLARAGVHACRATGAQRRRGVRPALLAATAVALCYGGLGAVAAVFARNPAVSPARAGVGLAGFALVAAAGGALASRRGARPRAMVLRTMLLDAGRTAATAASLVVAAGAAAAGVLLAVHGGAASDLLGSYHAGVLGQAGITALCLAYAPNFAIWSASYLLGPGFTIGAGSVVSPSVVTIGPLPALPVLAALPGGPTRGAATAVIAIPFLASAGAGWLLSRRRAGTGWGRLASAAAAGPVAGLLLGLAARASAGSLGNGRLAELGPDPWRVALIASAVVSVGALVGAFVGGAVHRPARA
ncbi:MAG: DUF6350 family protein [Micromonosporaceae bacterium]